MEPKTVPATPHCQGANNNLFGRILAAVLEALATLHLNRPEVAKVETPVLSPPISKIIRIKKRKGI